MSKWADYLCHQAGLENYIQDPGQARPGTLKIEYKTIKTGVVCWYQTVKSLTQNVKYLDFLKSLKFLKVTWS